METSVNVTSIDSVTTLETEESSASESMNQSENGNIMNSNISERTSVQQHQLVVPVREVFASNLRGEFKEIRRKLLNNFNYVAMCLLGKFKDTEFPGIVLKACGTFRSVETYKYEQLKVNCDSLNIIQLGITLFDQYGNTHPDISSWQFNFKFDLGKDMYASESVQLLQDCGVPFDKMKEDGIDPFEFAEFVLTSGLVLSNEVKWITFHGFYDFGYLYRVLTSKKLPSDEKDFVDILRLHFPIVYDLKYLMKSCKKLRSGGLQQLADDLNVEREGLPMHQAGCDSLVTGRAFFRMKEMFFKNKIDHEKYNGQIFGLSLSYSEVPVEPELEQPKKEGTVGARGELQFDWELMDSMDII